ncbi:MAG TPA: shikimate dehydrogenase [Acidimicrobiia bacterium]|nr:shikimate dehydrogenase [Acidimicrobiia bacterium]
MMRVALIGSPLKRRHSAVMHNAAFRHYQVDATYELRELFLDQLDGFFVEARGEEWLGFQVTAPYKQEALARCDEVDHAARRIGAVNSVERRPDGSLVGFNSDAPGFARSVQTDLGLDMKDAVVAVAGAGGAARAVIDAALEAGASTVIVGNRTRSTAERLVESIGDERLHAAELGEEFESGLDEANLAVNATTVGMTTPGSAFDVARLGNGAAVFDLVYVPSKTEVLETATARGLAAANGAGMLVAQAEIAFERWTGIAAAGGVMREAVEPILQDPGSGA